ncbi:hypothetical protein BKA93DRAFT_713336, partial [Sparassis latifolia]
MTAHKAQGQSLKKVIIDLQSCRGTEAPYVIISRATSLDGLLILRPFTREKITCHHSEESRLEMHCLQLLQLST